MNDSELNLAICEWMGWTIIDVPFVPAMVVPDETYVFTKEAARQWRLCYPNGKTVRCLPDYLSDDSPRRLLNEAEAKMVGAQFYRWCQNLVTVVIEAHGTSADGSLDITDVSSPVEMCGYIAKATARQRVIAILRTVNHNILDERPGSVDGEN